MSSTPAEVTPNRSTGRTKKAEIIQPCLEITQFVFFVDNMTNDVTFSFVWLTGAVASVSEYGQDFAGSFCLEHIYRALYRLCALLRLKC